ncbi:DNA mismatch repair protein MutL [Osmia lignaria lignaria]|uniref:DNA mismatch repair protein MutL n=1 Tax=Osmia lignaria lignaria TaxID=1437193 RepID=UPI00402BAE3C
MNNLVITTLNVTNIAECILELVLNSLSANATSIAIRIHAEKRKIQVIDNGVGIPKENLKVLAEYKDEDSYNNWDIHKIYYTKKQTLVNIRKLSNALLISSRHCDSSKTYTKIFKVCHDPEIIKVSMRPAHGTTVSIYGFHELSLNKWNIPLMYHLIANVSMVNVQVSFSIRDDQEKDVIMTVSKPHNPVDIFQLLYNKEVKLNNIWYIQSVEEVDVKFSAYIGLTNIRSKATQYVFLNNKLVHCPLILEVISAIFNNTFKCFTTTHCEQKLTRKAVFILIFITCTDYVFTMINEKRTLVLPNIQELLQNIKKEILNIFTKNIAPLSNHVSKYVRRDKNLIYNCISNLNGTKLFKSTLIPQLSISKKDERLHTIYNIKTKITKLTASEIQRGVDYKENASEVNSIDHFQTDNFNTEENLPQDRRNKTQLTESQVTDMIPLFTPVSQNKEVTTLTLTEWSDWSYSDKRMCNVKKLQAVSTINYFQSNFLKAYKRFDFLPEKLHKQLRGNIKLTKIDILNDLGGNISSEKLKFGLQDMLLHQEIDVRPCKIIKHLREFRLKKEFLQFLKILGQTNNELIVGLLNQHDMKVLLLMDQHAVHERIRYENLLHKYKSQTKNYLLFIKLKDPIVIELSVDKCNLLVSNKVTFNKFGITFNVMNGNTVIVYTIPECLNKNKYYEFKLKLNVKALLNEILQNIATYGYYGTSNLPFIIHNAIAMEACHGMFFFYSNNVYNINNCDMYFLLIDIHRITISFVCT